MNTYAGVGQTLGQITPGEAPSIEAQIGRDISELIGKERFKVGGKRAVPSPTMVAQASLEGRPVSRLIPHWMIKAALAGRVTILPPLSEDILRKELQFRKQRWHRRKAREEAKIDKIDKGEAPGFQMAGMGWIAVGLVGLVVLGGFGARRRKTTKRKGRK